MDDTNSSNKKESFISTTSQNFLSHLLVQKSIKNIGCKSEDGFEGTFEKRKPV